MVEDPEAIWRWIGVSANGLTESRVSPEIVYLWVRVLDDAREMELETAPSLRKYIEAGVSSTVAVAGLGLAFTGPVLGSVIATTALILGGLSGAIAFWQAGDLIRDDLQCAARLDALERAQTDLRRAVKA